MRGSGRGSTAGRSAAADPDWSRLLAASVPSAITSVQERRMSSLWAGYGHVSSLTLQLAAQEGPDKGQQMRLIVKQVQPPRDESGVSHERKVKSYQVEHAFYTLAAPELLAHTPLAIPRPVFLAVDPPSSFTFVLTDLEPDFPEGSSGSLDLGRARAALEWLAVLHAHYWEAPLPEGVWPTGTYWHLATRQDELAAMPRQWSDLQRAATAIDRLLAGLPVAAVPPAVPPAPVPPHQAGRRPAGSKAPEEDVSLGATSADASSLGGCGQPLAGGGGRRRPRNHTLVHGDFKSANLMFARDAGGGGWRCSAYDFQYTGGGLGVKDVAYLFCSSVPAKLLEAHEGQLLRHYHDALLACLAVRDASGGGTAAAGKTSANAACEVGTSGASQSAENGAGSVGQRYTFEACERDYELALLDFVRFMAGWGMWGCSDWASRRAKALMAKYSAELLAGT